MADGGWQMADGRWRTLPNVPSTKAIRVSPQRHAATLTPRSEDRAELPVSHQRHARAVLEPQVHAHGHDVGLRLLHVDAVDVNDRVGRSEGTRTHLPAEVLATPEGDVQAQLLIEQDGAHRLDAERGEHAQSELGEFGVGP